MCRCGTRGIQVAVVQDWEEPLEGGTPPRLAIMVPAMTRKEHRAPDSAAAPVGFGFVPSTIC